MVINALDIWWIRICLMLTVVLVPSLLLASLVHGDEAGIIIQSVVYGLCVVTMIGIEVLRPNGSSVASGIVPTSVSPRFAGIGIAWALVSMLAVASVAYVLGGTIVSVPGSIDVTAASTVILFAIGEEILFRGTIFRAVEERFGSSIAVLATSLPFALVHLTNPGASAMSAVNVFLAGVALGTSVALTRSLWTAIAFHVTWNLGVALVFGLVSGIDMPLDAFVLNVQAIPVHLQFIVTGPFGVEDGLVTSILFIGVVISMRKLNLFDPFVQAARYRQRHSLTR